MATEFLGPGHAQEPGCRELADQFAPEEGVLEVIVDDRQDALGRERARRALPGALVIRQQLIEHEHRVDEGYAVGAGLVVAGLVVRSHECPFARFGKRSHSHRRSAYRDGMRQSKVHPEAVPG